MSRPSLYLELVPRIEADLREASSERLPSISALARSYGVAYGTMRKAIQVLKTRGIVQSFPGRGTERITPNHENDQATPSASSRAAHTLFETLRDQILAGQILSGNPLQKVEYFVLTYRVSRHTVLAAFGLLQQEGLAHRSGKRWIAGPSPRSVPNVSLSRKSVTRTPTILVITRVSRTAPQFFNNSHTSLFSRPFSVELRRWNLRQLVGAMKEGADENEAVSSNYDGIRQTIRSLGELYHGALIHPGFGTDIGLLDEWLPMLLSFSKPVVFFDSTNQGAEYSRKRLGTGSRYFRFFFDEESAVRIALEALVDQGHTSIACPVSNDPSVNWFHRRLACIRKVSRSFPEISVLPTLHTETFWHLSGMVEHADFTQRISASVHPDAPANESRRSAWLLDKTPSLRRVFQQGATALLAGNDALARDYLQWCNLSDIHVPKDLSLLSFGNIAESVAYPISTVDFGFEQLGYLAAHVFIGDIPIPGSNRGIGGRCSVIDRGSVAAAPHRPVSPR